jgi:hypothetical protein
MVVTAGRRKTMSHDRHKTEQASETRPGDRPLSLDCCGVAVGGGKAYWPCGFVMRRHPVVATVILAVVGLAMLVIAVGTVLGIVAFLKTI